MVDETIPDSGRRRTGDAREQAIDAMADALYAKWVADGVVLPEAPGGRDLAHGDVVTALDAIPPKVHAKLAIAKGGLEPAAKDPLRSKGLAFLYRLAEEGKQGEWDGKDAW